VAVIERIRQRIGERDYYLSSHAEDELAEEGFDRCDAEHAILNGFVEMTMTNDPRGTRYRVEGPAGDGRLMHVVCRFREVGSMVLIAAYEKGSSDEV
jgi:hypothetical protein